MVRILWTRSSVASTFNIGHEKLPLLILQAKMYGLHESTSANILDFVCFYLIQNAIPAAVLVTTPKGSPLRYLTILCLIWIASRFILPFAPAGSPAWCQAICGLVLVVLQAIHFLLLHPLDRHDISKVAKGSQNFVVNMFEAAKLLIQTRGVNTPWQVKNVPSHPLYFRRGGIGRPGRAHFLLRQFSIFLWQYLLLDIIQTISIQNSTSRTSLSLKTEWNISPRHWLERGATHLVIWLIVNRLIQDSAYRVLSIIFVGLGVDNPSDWPPAFGSVSELYTLRNFWG